jgi:hypothetical protein
MSGIDRNTQRNQVISPPFPHSWVQGQGRRSNSILLGCAVQLNTVWTLQGNRSRFRSAEARTLPCSCSAASKCEARRYTVLTLFDSTQRSEKPPRRAEGYSPRQPRPPVLCTRDEEAGGDASLGSALRATNGLALTATIVGDGTATAWGPPDSGFGLLWRQASLSWAHGLCSLVNVTCGGGFGPSCSWSVFVWYELRLA